MSWKKIPLSYFFLKVILHNLPNLNVSRGNRMDRKCTIPIVFYVFLVLGSRKNKYVQSWQRLLTKLCVCILRIGCAGTVSRCPRPRPCGMLPNHAKNEDINLSAHSCSHAPHLFFSLLTVLTFRAVGSQINSPEFHPPCRNLGLAR